MIKKKMRKKTTTTNPYDSIRAASDAAEEDPVAVANAAGGGGEPSYVKKWIVCPIMIVGLILVVAATLIMEETKNFNNNEKKKWNFNKNITNIQKSGVVDNNPEDDPYYCQWDPNNNNNNNNNSSTGVNNCLAKWIPQICNHNDNKFNNNNKNRIGTRILLFGDSTMYYLSQQIRTRLNFPPESREPIGACYHTVGFRCHWKHAARCGNRRFWRISSQDTVIWNQKQPQPGKEGPTNYGLTNHGCSDCAGCKTGFVSCHTIPHEHSNNNPCHDASLQQTTTTHSYQGGYINIEFARDIILQTWHYNTTQENIAYYFLEKNYNTPHLVQAFGKPYCFVNTGHHDVLIPGITLDVYLQNVKWYLSLLQPQCQQIIWISTRAPLVGKDITKEWNNGVYQMLLRQNTAATEYQQSRILFLDVFNASIYYQQHDKDNNSIHMNPSSWYETLANFIGDLIESCAAIIGDDDDDEG